ncbi:MAG: ribonuclease HI [Pseudomonadota bacterium]
MNSHQNSKRIAIYTDGACRGNPGPGGWGAIICDPQQETCLNGGESNTTNNRMELMAAIKALSALAVSSQIDLTTDSQYLRLGITEWLKNWKKNGWKTSAKKPVKNKDLWEMLDHEIKRHDIDWHWVKGHSGHPGNEKADTLANQAIDDMLKTGVL